MAFCKRCGKSMGGDSLAEYTCDACRDRQNETDSGWDTHWSRFSMHDKTCSFCGGKGYLKSFSGDKEKCDVCNGKGRYEQRDDNYEEKHQRYLDSHNYDKVKGGCFIVTACTESTGLSAKRLELKALCQMKKEYVTKSQETMRDLVKYNKLAPQIVNAINSRKDAKDIWTKVYNSVAEAVKMIKQGNYEKGFTKYKSIVLELKETAGL